MIKPLRGYAVKKEEIAIQEQMNSAGGSAFEKYQRLIVGRKGLGAFVLYELAACVSGWPGAAGLWLRGVLYRRVLGSCGRGVVFGRYTTLRHPHKIQIADGVVIDDGCLLDAKGEDNQGIRIGNGVFVGRNSILSCKNGDITVGDKVNIGFNCEIVSASEVLVGAGSLLAAYSYLVGADHIFSDPEKPIHEQERCSRGIRLEENVWVGAGVVVADGQRLGRNSIIGAGAVVTSDVPEYAIAAGVPARVLRDRRETGDKPDAG